jgi:hypothetical protein
VFRSLLKIPFTQRMDHSKKGTLTVSFVVWFSICSRCPAGNRRLGSLLLHALCARSFGIRIRLKPQSRAAPRSEYSPSKSLDIAT